MNRQDFRLLPAAAAAWGGAFLGIGAASWGWGLVPVAMVVLYLAWRYRKAVVVVATAAFVVSLSVASLRAEWLNESVIAQWAVEQDMVLVQAEVTSEARRVGSGHAFVMIPANLQRIVNGDQEVGTEQPVLVFASGELAQDARNLAPGSVVEIKGRARPTDPASPQALSVSASNVELLHSPGRFDVVINGLRTGLREAASHAPPDQAALVPSLVVGDTELVGDTLTEEFRATALSHLLAVSGANLTLMLGVLLIAARAVGVRGWAVRVVALAGVGIFVVLCRFEPSVVRAAAMGTITLLATGLGRGHRTIRTISAAIVVLLLLDPWLARNFAFALSVSACLGISVWAGPWSKRMSGWAPRWMAEGLCIPLAAQLATQPIIVALSGQVSIVGVLANILAAPFVGPATVLGLIAALLSPLPGVAALFAQLAGACVQPIIWIARTGSALPGASITWPDNGIGVAVAALGCAAAGWGIHRVVARRWATLGLVIAIMGAAMIRPVVLGWPGDWRVVFCDVGQGDATVLRAAPGVGLLVDAGPKPRPVLDCLTSLGIEELPMVVLTHYHADHLGGMDEILRRYDPEMILVSPLASPATAASAVEAAAGNTPVVVAQPGQQFVLGAITWTTVGAWEAGPVAAEGEGESAAENDSSVISVADVGGLRVLLPGDADHLGQRRAVANARRLGISLEVDVVKLAHHGASAQEPALLAATGAHLAVVSAGEDNLYGHPTRTALDLAADHGMAVVGTHTGGSVALGFSDGELEVRQR